MKVQIGNKINNAKRKRDSLRTIVGPPGTEGCPDGMVVLDTNDSARFFGLFAVCEGGEGFTEFCPEFLRNRFEDHSDIYRRGAIDQPAKFLSGLLKEMLSEWRRAQQSEGGAEPDASALLVIRGTVVAARCGMVPIFLWQSNRMRPVFHLDRKPRQEVEVVVFHVSDGDRIVMCPNSILERLTKFELKNTLASEEDVSMVSGKLAMLAGRYEEISSPRILVVGFSRNTARAASAVPRRTLLVAGLLLAATLGLFLWGDIYRFIEGRKSPYVFTAGQRAGKPSAKSDEVSRLKKYRPVEVYGNLAVPYDAAAASENEFFIVDDRESAIVYYNSANKTAGRISVRPGLIFPTSIEIFRDILYVVDFSASASRVYIFTRAGDFLRRIPDGRSVHMKNPKAIAITEDGNMYVCDRGNNRILKFSPDAKLLKTILLPEEMVDPNGIAIAPGGDIFITLKTSNGIARITDEKSAKNFAILDGEKTVSLYRPAGIAIDKQSYIYVADTGNRRVISADPMGQLTGLIDSTVLSDFVSFYPMSVKLGPDGNHLYIIGSNQHSFEPENREMTKGKIWRISL
ncbi:MAG: NHL repeat-containing protein [bacterium]